MAVHSDGVSCLLSVATCEERFDGEKLLEGREEDFAVDCCSAASAGEALLKKEALSEGKAVSTMRRASKESAMTMLKERRKDGEAWRALSL